MARHTARNMALGALLLVLVAFVANCGGGGGGGDTPPAPPPTDVPAAPTSIIATAVSTSQINISWSASSGAHFYKVYRSTQPGTAYTVLFNTSATSTSDTAISAGTTYYYVVSGINSLGEGGVSGEVSAMPATPGGLLTIQGVVKYEDIEYDSVIGQTGNTKFKVVRNADIELYSVISGATLVAGQTTSTGTFSFAVDKTTQLNKAFYARVMSVSTPVGSQKVYVKNLGSTPAIYAVKTGNFTLSGDSNINLSIPISNAADGAFNILDVFSSAFEFVYSYATTTQTTALTAFWQPNNRYGTYYCPSYAPGECWKGTGIYVLNDPVYDLDTDEFDDDVLWHEFGHFVADKFSVDESPGGWHYMFRNEYDLRLTWSEGWGNFMQAAIKSTLSSSLLSSKPGEQASAYVDTFIGDSPLIVDIASPDDGIKSPYCFGDCRYASNEIAVANVLWNLLSGSGGFGMQPIWDVIDVFDQNYPRITSPINLETFWNEWLYQRAIPAELPTLTGIYQARSIVYSSDAWAADDVITTASTYTYGFTQQHSLYNGPTTMDIDYISFNVIAGQRYTIGTIGLLNGADTFIRVFSPDQSTIIGQNDNTSGILYVAPFNYDSLYRDYKENGDDLLASQVILSSSTTNSYGSGTYYLSVSSSASRPMSSGKYGSYVLMITTP